jgi:excisionase family DNA binding protein
MANDRYITATETARKLSMGRDSVHRYLRSGRIPTVMVDGRRRILRADITAMANAPAEARLR